jgi:hypothetical protein
MYREEGWTAFRGWAWLYYNTRKGKKPAYRTEEQELWSKSPWVLKRFKDPAAAYSKDPDRASWNDIFCQEVVITGSTSKTVYVDDPPWRGRRDSVRYVRGYLLVEGTIRYR